MKNVDSYKEEYLGYNSHHLSLDPDGGVAPSSSGAEYGTAQRRRLSSITIPSHGTGPKSPSMDSRIPGLKLASGFAPYPEEQFSMKDRKATAKEGHWMDNHAGEKFKTAENNYITTGYAVQPTANQTNTSNIT